MEIRAIKEQLGILEVLSRYGLEVKNKMTCCPFHEDRTPSMQVFDDSNTVRCYSGNCPQGGKVIDVIDFIMYREGCGKHDAIEKAKAMVTGSGSVAPVTVSSSPEKKNHYKFHAEIDPLRLDELFGGFAYNLRLSRKAQDYLQERCLDRNKLEVGYNARSYKGLCNCVIFPLKDKEGHIVSLYGRSVTGGLNKHFYMKNRSGLYPGYPDEGITKLILFESVIDCATMLQYKELLEASCGFLACYGTNGFTTEHKAAIGGLKGLREIIFCFDNDEAGITAVNRYREELSGLYPRLTVSTADLPCKDLNETLQGHSPEVLPELLATRKTLFPSTENKKAGFLHQPPVRTVNEGGAPSPAVKIANINAPTVSIPPENTKLRGLQDINACIGRSGIVGEENTRLLLFIIASSYRTAHPLHAIVQGSSGSGKTHLIGRIADLMPQKDVLRFTRITESSLYNWGEYDLVGKLLVIEDLDGLKEEALYALRELISNQRLSSSVSIKDKKGNIRSAKKEVNGRFSSLSATTKGDIYEDNISRSFTLAVDESPEQSRRIIDYQNRRYAGEVLHEDEEKARKQLRDFTGGLQDYPVRNHYATRLELPREVHKIRRLNEMYQSIIRQITYLNQRDRQVKDGFLITQVEDLEQATDILFDSIILKIDELDGSLRQFYERLKKYAGHKDKEFYLRETRLNLNISKTQMFRYIQALRELDYIRPCGGYNNTGFKYKILYWDDYHKLREQIKGQLQRQIKQLPAYINSYR